MNDHEKIVLGCVCEDVLTGFKGIAVLKCTWMFGCDHYVLTPYEDSLAHEREEKSKKFPLMRLKRVPDSDTSLIVQETVGRQDEFFGKICQDKVTGFQGVCIGRISYLYESDQYYLVPKIKAGKNKLLPGEWFDEGRLLIIEPYLKREDVSQPKPGGCDFLPSPIEIPYTL